MFNKLTTVEIIKGSISLDRLYWTSYRNQPAQKANIHYITTDQQFVYQPYCYDFGPLNISCVYKFCQLMTQTLENSRLNQKIIIYYSSQEHDKRANSAYLICAYAVLILKQDPESVWQKLQNLHIQPRPFRDAGQSSKCEYECTILDCMQAIQKAVEYQFFDLDTFDVDQYDFREQLQNGDISVIVPSKLFAFSSPQPKSVDEQGYKSYTPRHYIPVFRKMGIGTIIRLNRDNYDRTIFTKARFSHHDLYFKDGTIPPAEIIDSFCKIVSEEPKGVAVHCKAGLGRTGTLIGCYMIRNFQITGREFIAWSRIMRPGSVLGPQQEFLLEYYRRFKGFINLEFPILDIEDIESDCEGDKGQADRLLYAKSCQQSSKSTPLASAKKVSEFVSKSYRKVPSQQEQRTRVVRRRFRADNIIRKKCLLPPRSSTYKAVNIDLS